MQLTLKAKWNASCAYAINSIWTFEYNGNGSTVKNPSGTTIDNIGKYTVPCNGYYRLQVWGASGGNGYYQDKPNSPRGGYGAYSEGVSILTKSENLYIYVGQGSKTCNYLYNSYCAGAYNGGGGAGSDTNGSKAITAVGGGATHIATIAGILSSLEPYKGTWTENAYYVSDKILIVAGGGAGGYPHDYAGGDAGGLIGTEPFDINTGDRMYLNWIGATFGQGGNGRSGYASGGGGGGFTGGALRDRFGEGGTGYIASSRLISTTSLTKHMTCYSCTTSTSAATRTNSNTNVSATATADYSKIGNGYARITFLGASI